VRAAEAPPDVRAQVFTVGASVRTSAYALTTAGLAVLADERFRTAVGVGAVVQVVALGLGLLAAVSRGTTGRAGPAAA
jgi:O-methyltransferase involved in polyketide biosynthesis